MNGIVLLMLMATAAQVGTPSGTERDFGWEIDKDDGVLQYIVQISPQEVQVMQQKSVAFPLGQENLSDIPPQLVGRATRVVVRIGDAVLPRTPSLQELERMPRSGDPVNPSSTAQLGPGRISDVEPSLYNIQGNGQPLSLPDFPSAGPGGAGSPQSDEANRVGSNTRSGNDTLGAAANPLPNTPDLSMLAQNNQSALAQSGNAFLQGAMGGNKFNNTGSPSANPPPSTPPPSTNSNLPTNPIGNAGWGPNSNPNVTGTGTSLPGYPANSGLNPPSLQYPNALPNQQTPTPTFGSSPTYTGGPYNGTGNMGSNANYNQPPMSPLNNPYSSPTGFHQNSGLQPLPNSLGTNQFSTNPNASGPYVSGSGTQNSDYGRIAANNSSSNQSRSQLSPPNPSASQEGGLGSNNRDSFSDGLPQTGTVDGILQVFFLLSLVVNFYLGLLIRKLLTRYRSLLMNVRSQTA